VINARGETTTCNYDATSKQLSNVTQSSSTQPAVQVAAYGYDAMGRTSAVTDAFGATRYIEYNDLDKPVKTNYADGSREVTDYVCCRLPGVTIDRAGRKTYYDYDESKRLRRAQDANGNTVQMDYDNAGNMTSLMDARGSLTRWEYDGLNRVSRKIYADGSREGYAYDGAGRLVRSYDARGQVTIYTYDAVGHLTSTQYPNSPTESFSYNDLDQATGMTDNTGSTQWSYDLLGRKLSETGPWANDTVSCSYDELSRFSGTNINGNYATNFAYDALGRLTDATSPAATSTATGKWHWDYNPAQVGYSASPTQLTLPSGAKTQYNWQSSLERLTQITNLKSDGATVLSQFAYGFDDVNKFDARMSQARQMRGTDGVLGAAQTINYGYDGVDQLKTEVSTEATPQVNSSFNYDSMGNRTYFVSQGAGIGGTTAQNVRVGADPNRLNQFNSIAVTNTDNTTSSQSFAYDARGNTIRTESTGSDRYALYFYDDANRLVNVLWQKRGNQPSPYLSISQSAFFYDGLGRRREVIEQTYNGTTNTNGTWTTTSDTLFVYNGMDVVQERDGNNVVRANLTRVGNIGGLLSRQTYTSAGVLDKTAFYAYDGSGNVVGTTDASQNVQSAYWYDAFGNTQKLQENTSYSQPYRYSTQWLHSPTGLYSYGYRFYNAGLGRWINRDPLRETGGNNLYAMVGNSPLNSVDLYGSIGVGVTGGVNAQGGAGSAGGAGFTFSGQGGGFYDPATGGSTVGGAFNAGGFMHIPGVVNTNSGVAYGAEGGYGPGLFATNAPNAAALAGAGVQTDISIGFEGWVSLSVSRSGPYTTVSLTGGPGIGLAASTMNTMTLAGDIPIPRIPVPAPAPAPAPAPGGGGGGGGGGRSPGGGGGGRGPGGGGGGRGPGSPGGGGPGGGPGGHGPGLNLPGPC